MQIDEDTAREHDFGHKLRQERVLAHLRNLVAYGRQLKAGNNGQPPNVPLLSINLDITSGCDHACGHCVDDLIINSAHFKSKDPAIQHEDKLKQSAGRTLSYEDCAKTIKTLAGQGLQSIILIGGGEPTLHPRFGDIVAHIKSYGLQLGIVSHGGHGERIAAVAPMLGKKDWVRFSIDAATNETYEDIHWRQAGAKPTNTLSDVLENFDRIRATNQKVQLGYSYVIFWEGSEYHGRQLRENIAEIPAAARNAREHGCTYLALKPCLIKHEDKGETLLYHAKPEYIAQVCERIKQSIQQAHEEAGNVRVIQSQNLRAMLEGYTDRLREQPYVCWTGFLRQVINPKMTVHCPAFRGDPRAAIGNGQAYISAEALAKSRHATSENLRGFDATHTCSEIACFYNGVNRYIQELIDSDIDLQTIKPSDAEDLFL